MPFNKCVITALYPSNNIEPQLIGPVIINNVTFNGAGPYSDFYFICRINYTHTTTDDGARFDVVLTADGQLQETKIKTTDSTNLDVIFTSHELAGLFGKHVSTEYNVLFFEEDMKLLASLFE